MIKKVKLKKSSKLVYKGVPLKCIYCGSYELDFLSGSPLDIKVKCLKCKAIFYPLL